VSQPCPRARRRCRRESAAAPHVVLANAQAARRAVHISQRGLVDARRTAIAEHRNPRTPQDVSAIDLVPQRMKPSPGVSLGRPVKRTLQGTDRICGNRSHSGGTSHFGHSPSPSITALHIDEAAALPSPTVMLSARLKQYYGRLRRPPGTPPTSRITGYRARRSSNTNRRRSPGRGGPLQFPPSPLIRSEPHTPGSPSAPALPGLQRLPWPSP
jgi:hypothetical protein